MDLGKVIGRATATIKHPTFAGWRMLVVQPIDVDGRAEGEPIVALDNLGCRRGDEVILTSDGPAVRELVKADNSPARWAILGLKDA
jgi:ethanolamine utilization protein EutN